MTRPRLLIIGNSHTRMISRALAARTNRGVPSAHEIEVCWLTTPGKSTFGDTSREEAQAKVERLGPDDLLVVTWLGTAHNVAGLLEHEIPFSLAETVDGPVDAPPDAQIIPLSLMRAMLDEWIRRDDVVSRYSAVAPCTIVHMMAPPPKEKVQPRQKPDQPEEAREDMRFAAPQSRLALWKLEAALIRRYVTGLGVRHYESPAGARDTRGFLAESFQAPDVTHANAAYGELCLQEFEAMLAATTASAAQGSTP